MLLGDLNSRTGKYDDHISISSEHLFISNKLEESIIPTTRNNCDTNLNNHGKKTIRNL